MAIKAILGKAGSVGESSPMRDRLGKSTELFGKFWAVMMVVMPPKTLLETGANVLP